MSEFDEISDEEKLKIAQHFLLSSPPGQFNEVLSDVRRILPEGLLTDPLAEAIARIYHNRTGKVVNTAAGKTVLSAASEIDAGHYFNSASSGAIAADHLHARATDDSSIEVPANFSGEESGLGLHRNAIYLAVKQYVQSQYQPSENAAVSVVGQAGTHNLIINITGEKNNLKSFWSGRYSSSWIVNVGEGSISGEIKIHAHIFEDGNVQLQQNKSIATSSLRSTSSSSEAELARAVVAFIQGSESALQEGLEEMYRNMNEETLKAMRRVMPITKNKMEWNINAVRMVRQTQAGKK